MSAMLAAGIMVAGAEPATADDLTADDFKDASPPVSATKTKPGGGAVIAQLAGNPAKENKPLVSMGGQPHVFIWSSAIPGHWSDVSKWTNNLATGTAPSPAGRQDYVLNFTQPGKYDVVNDLQDGLVLNQLNSSATDMKVEGWSITFAANGATATQPHIQQVAPGSITIIAPVKLEANLIVEVMRNGDVTLDGQVSGTGGLVKNGDGQLRVTHAKNTYTGGTIINHGSLCMFVANDGLGPGPITLNAGGSLDLERVSGFNPLILNGGTIHAGNGFGDRWNGPMMLNGNTNITSTADFVLGGGMNGPGGFTHIGGIGGCGPTNSGTVTLAGSNNYDGPTIVRRGTLRVLKASSLYHADPARWTPAHITVHPSATLALNVGGPDELTGAHVGTLLHNLTSSVRDNGLMERAVVCLDTANAKTPVVIPNDLSDSKGPGGGEFLLRKCGAGTLQLSGTNSYTGPTTVSAGTLALATVRSLGSNTEVTLSSEATLALNFNGEMHIGKLTIDGKSQPAGTYSAANTPKSIKGTGALKTQ